MRRLLFLLVLAVMVPGEARAETAHAKVLGLVDDWYAELLRRDEGRPYRLTAAGFIEASPIYEYVETRAAVLGPPVFTSLAAKGLKFDYEVHSIRVDPNFAKVRVWEKGYFYAAATESSYELAASTLFILERNQVSSEWQILAYESASAGIPPTLKTIPMPDMRKAWETRQLEDGNGFLTPAN